MNAIEQAVAKKPRYPACRAMVSASGEMNCTAACAIARITSLILQRRHNDLPRVSIARWCAASESAGRRQACGIGFAAASLTRSGILAQGPAGVRRRQSSKFPMTISIAQFSAIADLPTSTARRPRAQLKSDLRRSDCGKGFDLRRGLRESSQSLDAERHASEQSHSLLVAWAVRDRNHDSRSRDTTQKPRPRLRTCGPRMADIDRNAANSADCDTAEP